MKLLALDTATESCSAALWLDGRVVLREQVAPRGHADLLLPMCEAVLAEGGVTLAELDGVACGRGPGSFTGVRIAVSAAQGLAHGAGLPAVAVSDLAALARGAWRAHGWARVLAAIDARMGELYLGAFTLGADGAPSLVGAERVATAASLELPPGGWAVAGSGWKAQGPALAARLGAALLGHDGALLPSAADVAALAAVELAAGRGGPAFGLQPVYLRDRVAETTAERDGKR